MRTVAPAESLTVTTTEEAVESRFTPNTARCVVVLVPSVAVVVSEVSWMLLPGASTPWPIMLAVDSAWELLRLPSSVDSVLLSWLMPDTVDS